MLNSDLDAAKAAASQLKIRIRVDAMIFAAPEAKALVHASNYIMFRRINPANEITDAGFRNATLALMLQDLTLCINRAEYVDNDGHSLSYRDSEELREWTTGALQAVSLGDTFNWNA